MTYVYLLRSESHPSQTCIGFTRDLRTRLADHNSGLSKHTAKHLLGVSLPTWLSVIPPRPSHSNPT